MVRVLSTYLLFFGQAVTASIYPPVKNATNFGFFGGVGTSNMHVAAPVLAHIPSPAQPTYITVKPDTEGLPTAPLLSTDELTGPAIKIPRNPAYLKNYNTVKYPQDQANHTVLLEAIPTGLRPYWEVVKAECAWFDEKKSSVLVKLFQIIINDLYDEFIEFQDTFHETFGVHYNKFSENGRSVISWLISFGSVNILRSIDLKAYEISRASLDKSVKYLVDNSQSRFLAILIDQCPFLLKHNIFYHVTERVPKHEYLNLSFLITGLKNIDIVTITGLLPLLKAGEEVSGLISIASSIVSDIKNPVNVFNYGTNREETILQFKTALSQFFERCIVDFKILSESESFSIAHLFIDTGNVAALGKLLDTFPGLINAYGNYQSLLQINMISSTNMNTAALLVRKNPSAVVALVNQYQTPFFQAVYSNRKDYFDLFYPTLENNNIIRVHGIPVPKGLTPISIVMMYGNRDMLHKLVTHFNSINVPVDLRMEFEATLSFLETASSTECGSSKYQVLTLVPHEIWMYLLDEAKIEVGPVSTSRFSLLEFAVIDRNPEIVRKVLADPRTDVNRIFKTNTYKGNCLIFMKGDLAVMKLLVEKGININVPIETFVGTEDSPTSRTETIRMYKHLMTIDDPDFVAYLNTLNFTDRT